MSEFEKMFSGIFAAIIGLAIIAVIFSKSSQTSGVLNSLFTGLTNLVKAATGPINSSVSIPNSVAPSAVSSGANNTGSSGGGANSIFSGGGLGSVFGGGGGGGMIDTSVLTQGVGVLGGAGY